MRNIFDRIRTVVAEICSDERDFNRIHTLVASKRETSNIYKELYPYHLNRELR
jgi:hypothetical protein